MKGSEVEKLAKRYILPAMPTYVVRGRLVFESPLEYLVRGYCFEPSAFSKEEFCVELFVQPLFVIQNTLVFSIGGRLGTVAGKQEQWWTLRQDNEAGIMSEIVKHMQREGPRILDKFKTLRDVADRAVRQHGNQYTLYAPEMAAYAAILIDDAETAMRMFHCAEDRFVKTDDRRDWRVAVMERIRMMRQTFERDRGEAKAILNRWRDETAANLKLTKYLAPVPEHPV